jgi:hypothetical protein
MAPRCSRAVVTESPGLCFVMSSLAEMARGDRPSLTSGLSVIEMLRDSSHTASCSCGATDTSATSRLTAASRLSGPQ